MAVERGNTLFVLRIQWILLIFVLTTKSNTRVICCYTFIFSFGAE